MFVFKNPRDMSQFSILARQVFPKKASYLIDVYNNELVAKHSYLQLDFKQATNDLLRVRSGITKQHITVYVPTESSTRVRY